MELTAREGQCPVCYREVTTRQHAMECDGCRRWTHRLCGTGVTYSQYRDVMYNMRRGITFSWLCHACTAPSAAAASVSNDDQADDVTLPCPVLESTRIDDAANPADDADASWSTLTATSDIEDTSPG